MWYDSYSFYQSQSNDSSQIGLIANFARDLKIYYPDRIDTAHCIVAGYRAICYNHFFSEYGYNPVKIEIMNAGVAMMSFLSHQFTITQSQPAHRDLVYIDFSPKCMSAQQSCRNKCYADEQDMKDRMSLHGEFSRMTKTYLSDNEVVIERIRRNDVVIGMEHITSNKAGQDLDLDNYYIMAGGLGEYGDCGEIYTQKDSTGVYRIVGIHVGRSGSNSYFAPIFASDWPTQSSGSYVSQHAFIPRYIENQLEGCTESHTHFHNGKYMYMGKLKKKKIIPNKTNIIPSPAQGDTDHDHMYPLTSMPALLDVTYMETPYEKYTLHPLLLAMQKLGSSPARPFPRWMMDLMKHNSHKLLAGFFPTNMNHKNIRPWTLEEAAFGIPGVWQGIDLTTAVGYDMECLGFKSRCDVLDPDKKWIHPLLRMLVDDLDNAVRRGQKPKNVVFGCLKDETRDLDRVALGKTRLFCGGSLSHLLWTIKWMGGLVMEMKRCRSSADVAIGTNIHGHDWKNIYKKFEVFDGEWGGGDFGNYDTSENPWFGWMLGEACAPFYRFPTGSFEDDCIRAVCESALAPLLVILDTVFWMDYFNSSGGWLTGFLNSFVGVVILNAACYYQQAKHEQDDPEFAYADRKRIFPFEIYGDDNIWKIKRKYSKYLDMVFLKQFIYDVFGMDYTTPTKGLVDKPFLEEKDVSFLCRRFVPDGSLVRAPLAVESIHGMLLWIKKPVFGVSVEQQFIINVETACQEWFHYGRKRFEEETSHMKDYMRRYINCPWPGKSYNHYLERWLENVHE